MPTPTEILAGLTTIANEWRGVAIMWHLVAALAGLTLAAGWWRPTARRLARLLVLPLLTVAVPAALAGNPFNAAVFTVLAVALALAAARIADGPLRLASPSAVVIGTSLVAFGVFYPHFLAAGTWTAYLYAAPFGLLPCPTLAVLIGMTLVVDGLRARWWNATLAVAGLVYGIVGVVRLGVTLDLALLAGAALLGASELARTFGWRSVRASHAERTRAMAGDHAIASPLTSLTHAITIRGQASRVWPWLAQMGAGRRAGWYSYDFLDNGRQPSANRIVPELQEVSLGTVFPALPTIADGFVVHALVPGRALVLSWPASDGAPMVTWAFELKPRPRCETRLVVRVRARRDYRFRGLPTWISAPVITLVHFVMERKQLLGIARRVEAMSDGLIARNAPWQGQTA